MHEGLKAKLLATKPECDGPNGVWDVLRNPDGPEAWAAIEALTRPVDVEALADSIGPFTTKIRRTEDYSGEHREWLEDIVTPKGADIVYQVVKATVAALAAMGGRDADT